MTFTFIQYSLNNSPCLFFIQGWSIAKKTFSVKKQTNKKKTKKKKKHTRFSFMAKTNKQTNKKNNKKTTTRFSFMSAKKTTIQQTKLYTIIICASQSILSIKNSSVCNLYYLGGTKMLFFPPAGD